MLKLRMRCASESNSPELRPVPSIGQPVMEFIGSHRTVELVTSVKSSIDDLQKWNDEQWRAGLTITVNTPEALELLKCGGEYIVTIEKWPGSSAKSDRFSVPTLEDIGKTVRAGNYSLYELVNNHNLFIEYELRAIVDGNYICRCYGDGSVQSFKFAVLA